MSWLEEEERDSDGGYSERIECFLDIKKYMTRHVLCHAQLVPLKQYAVRSGAPAWVRGVFRVMAYLEEHREIWAPLLKVGRLPHWRDQPVFVWLNRARKDIVATSHEPAFDTLIAAEEKALAQEASSVVPTPAHTETGGADLADVRKETDEIDGGGEDGNEGGGVVLEGKEEKVRNEMPAKRRRRLVGVPITLQYKRRRIALVAAALNRIASSSSSSSSLSLSSSSPLSSFVSTSGVTAKSRRSRTSVAPPSTPMVLHPAFVRMRTQATFILLEEDLYSGAALASAGSLLSWAASSPASSEDAQRELTRRLVGCYFNCLNGCQRDSETVVNFLTHYFLSGLLSSPPRRMPWPDILYHFAALPPLCLLSEFGTDDCSSSTSTSASSAPAHTQLLPSSLSSPTFSSSTSSSSTSSSPISSAPTFSAPTSSAPTSSAPTSSAPTSSL